MKVLIVSTYDKGGAATACLNLHRGLLAAGIDSKVLLREKEKSVPATIQFQQAQNAITTKLNSLLKRIKNKITRYLNNSGLLENKYQSKAFSYPGARSKNLELFSYPSSKYDITKSNWYQEADIINLHWVANFLDYESFFRKNTKPVVWTLHDMNPFSGGEHYVESWLGMDDEGVPVNRQIRQEEQTLFNNIKAFKKNLIQKAINITVVAPSTWLKEEALKSAAFEGKKVEHIPYGVDTSVFKPRDQLRSRSLFNIPEGKTVVLFVADFLTNHRKGYAYLTKALGLLNCEDIVLCAIGGNNSELKATNHIIELGIIEDQDMMAAAYAAADVFVIPSLMDNLPNTVLESLLCGTPVIGFPIGGIKDMIDHGVNGLLAEQVSSQALALAITHFLKNKEIFDRDNIRKSAKKKYALSRQANAYISLFERILANSEGFKKPVN